MPGLVAQRILKVSAFLLVVACPPATVLAEGLQLNLATDLEYQTFDFREKHEPAPKRRLTPQPMFYSENT